MQVVIGIVFNANGAILIAKRPPNKYKPGLWEFPGGKIEEGESSFAALQREFAEEVGVHIISAESWMKVEYDYGDRVVLLDTWKITHFSGKPYGRENQEVLWVMPNQLSEFEFPPGNKLIIEKLCT